METGYYSRLIKMEKVKIYPHLCDKCKKIFDSKALIMDQDKTPDHCPYCKDETEKKTLELVKTG